MDKAKLNLQALSAHLSHTALASYGTYSAIRDLAPVWRFATGVRDNTPSDGALKDWPLFGGQSLGYRVMPFEEALVGGSAKSFIEVAMDSWRDAISCRGVLASSDERLREALRQSCSNGISRASQQVVLAHVGPSVPEQYAMASEFADNVMFLTFNFLRFACNNQTRRALGFRAAIAALDIGMPYGVEENDEYRMVRIIRM